LLSCFIFINILASTPVFLGVLRAVEGEPANAIKKPSTELVATGQTGLRIPPPVFKGQLDIFRASLPSAAVFQKPTLQG
jgi:hypothetical protein